MKTENGFVLILQSGERIPVSVMRSQRKTIEVRVTGEGLCVRAPLLASERKIKSFLCEREKWIETNYAKVKTRAEKMQQIRKLTETELNAIVKSAKKAIPERVQHYAQIIGVTYGRIAIRKQRTKWGSCSSQGNLNFNCLLMLAPPEVLDSVVVHELCHRKEMNHSARFYERVRRAFPEYDKWNKWLKEHGEELMQRLPEKE